jgi:rubrerythrin
MKKTEQVIEVLNDLILINNDRISGYEKAAYEIRDKRPNMQELFLGLANESRGHFRDLHAKVLQMGVGPQREQAPLVNCIAAGWI